MKIALVTGANRGIGLEICRQLDVPGFTVILCSRDVNKGKQAALTLSDRIIVKQLDVTDEESIQNLFKYVDDNFGKLDVLVNNAGLGEIQHDDKNKVLAASKKFLTNNIKGFGKIIKKVSPMLIKTDIIRKTGAVEVLLTDVKQLMETNFYGAMRMIQVFYPLLLKSKQGRVINVSSGRGELKGLSGDYPGYSLSKASLNALTIMFSNELKSKGIKVNAMCPGWVKTDMGGPNAPRDVSQGADTAVWLATETEIPTGKFFRDRKEIDW